MNNGWITLHRKLLEWEWFDKSEMVHLFLFLLLSANHTDKEWRGIVIKRGQLVTSLDSIKSKTGLSLQTIRTCIKRLKSTSEITSKSTNRFTIVTILKYDSYQENKEPANTQTNKPANKQLTNDQQTTNKQLTTNNNDNNDNNGLDTKASLLTDEQSTQDNLNYAEIVKFFNSETNGVFGEVRYPISEKRKQSIRARVREHGKKAFADVVRKASVSNFLKGGNNRGFVATFDWLIRPNNFQKTLEGNYDNRAKKYEKRNTTSDEELMRNIQQGITRGIEENAI